MKTHAFGFTLRANAPEGQKRFPISISNSYNGKIDFFHNDQYTRYDWNSDRAEDGYPGDLVAWHLPASFLNGINAVLNGQAKFDGKAYFFKGDQYVQYDWKTDKPDIGDPKSISAWSLPTHFLPGVDAATADHPPTAYIFFNFVFNTKPFYYETKIH